MYDVAVVGLGPIGSAALRYLAASEATAVGIGPAEPANWVEHDGPFASHYDSGRITRRLDARLEWAILAVRSIEQYAEIEAMSGVRFHHPVGFAFARRAGAGLDQQRGVADALGIPIEFISSSELGRRFPDLSFPAGWEVAYDAPPAGFLDPRAMVEAQLLAAQSDGAEVVRASVEAIERIGGGFALLADNGDHVRAENVLIATGPYGNDLLAEPLAFRVVPEAAILGEVSAETAQRLAALPSFIYLLDHPEHDDVYAVPPTRYPDGKHYVKMGASIVGADALETPAEKAVWMKGDDANRQRVSMQEILQAVYPRVEFERFSMKPCLISDTVHGLPFIDRIDEGLSVAVGGNGHAAKSSDAIGQLAADLALEGRWTDTQLSADSFRAQFGTYRPTAGSRHAR